MFNPRSNKLAVDARLSIRGRLRPRDRDLVHRPRGCGFPRPRRPRSSDPPASAALKDDPNVGARRRAPFEPPSASRPSDALGEEDIAIVHVVETVSDRVRHVAEHGRYPHAARFAQHPARVVRSDARSSRRTCVQYDPPGCVCPARIAAADASNGVFSAAISTFGSCATDRDPRLLQAAPPRGSATCSFDARGTTGGVIATPGISRGFPLSTPHLRISAPTGARDVSSGRMTRSTGRYARSTIQRRPVRLNLTRFDLRSDRVVRGVRRHTSARIFLSLNA